MTDTNVLDAIWSAPPPVPLAAQAPADNPLDKIWQQQQVQAQAPATQPQAAPQLTPASSNPLDAIWSRPAPAVPVPAEPDSTWDKIKAFANHPLINFNNAPIVNEIENSTEAAQKYLESSGHTTLANLAGADLGIEQGIGSLGSGLTTPSNLALIAGASTGVGALGDLVGAAPETIAAIQRLSSLGFSISGLYTAAESFPAIKDALVKGDVRQAAQLITSAAGTIGLSGYAGIRSLGSVNPGAEPLQNAKLVNVAPTEAAKLEAEQQATIPVSAAKPTEAGPTVPAEEKLPMARIVQDSYVPTVSGPEIQAEATQRILNASPIIRQMVDPSSLKTPADITAALDSVADHIDRNLDPRVGTRISFPEQKVLAQELNMTPEKLLSKPSGVAFSAEGAIAARSILKNSALQVFELAKAGSDTDWATAVATHGELENQVLGIRSEAGRALGSYNIGDDELPQARLAKLLPQLSPEALDATRKIIAKLNPTDPDFERQVNSLISEQTPSSGAEKAFEVYRNGLLSSPSTWIKKSVSDSLMIALDATSKLVTGAGEWAKAKAGIADAPQEAFPSEAYWFTRGAMKSLANIKAVYDGSFDLRNLPCFEEPTATHAIKGLTGQIVRAPSTLLERASNLAYLASYQGEIESLAARQSLQEGFSGQAASARQAWLAEHPTDAMQAIANDSGLKNTFQNKLSGTLGQFQAMIASNPWLRWVMPFTRTPINIVRAGVDYSPIGLLRGTASGDLVAQSRGLIGSVIALGLGHLAATSVLSGGGPVRYADEKVKQETGWQAYSLHLGNNWYSVNQAQPLGLLLGSVADYVHATQHDEEPVTRAKAAILANSLSRETQNLPLLMSIGQVVDILTNAAGGGDTERAMDNMIASSTIPAIVKDAGYLSDRTIRAPRREGVLNPLPGLADTVQERIPGLTGNVPPAIGVTGQPIKRVPSSLGTANPFPVSQDQNNPVINELSRLGITTENAPKKITLKGTHGESIPLTPDESLRLQRAEQAAFYNLAAQAISNPSWSRRTDLAQKDYLSRLRASITANRLQSLRAIRQQAAQ